MLKQQLAVNGGPKTKTTPFGKGKRFGDRELEYLREALEQNTLFYWSGSMVKRMLERFKEMTGMPYAVATTSGTASIHVALGCAGVGPGDEVITSPITDMGTVIGILYQNAIPVFADLDAHSYNMTAESVAARITPKTKAVVVVHLAGNPADMDPIMALCRPRGIRVIEDCAQSYCCRYKNRLAGTIGDIGCFSTNDFKHISTGDGGMVLLHTEEDYRRALRFADKNYDRLATTPQGARTIPYLAPNYRMTELQGAVGLAQLEKLESICAIRRNYGDAITAGITGLAGIHPHAVRPEDGSSYWFYMLRVDEKELGASRDEFSRALSAEGIPNQAGYIPCCVYEYDLFQNRNAYDGTGSPWNCPEWGGTVSYEKGVCPEAEAILRTAVRLSVNEFYTPDDIFEITAGIRKVATAFAKEKDR